MLNLPDGQYVVWFRGELLRSVDWGGDPHNKAIAVSEGDDVRLSPRKSFERWREIVRLRSEPWSLTETGVRRDVASPSRRFVVPPNARRAADGRDVAAQPAARVDPDTRGLASSRRTTSLLRAAALAATGMTHSSCGTDDWPY